VTAAINGQTFKPVFAVTRQTRRISPVFPWVTKDRFRACV
jgi:hypothetical protein